MKRAELDKAWNFRRRQGQFLRIYLDALLWPLVSLVRAIQFAAGRLGSYVKENQGISRISQIYQQFLLANRYNIHPKNYYDDRLWSFWNEGCYDLFCFQPLFSGLLEAINDDADSSVLAIKSSFWELCEKNGLPAVQILSKISDSRWQWFGELAESAEFPEQDLFIKPNDSAVLNYGQGAEAWRFSSDRTWSRQGLALTSDQLRQYVLERSEVADYIVTPLVRNHPDVLKWTNGALSTLRIITLMGEARSPSFLLAMLRMPVDLSEVDNAASGGISAKVEADGMIGVGLKYDCAQEEFLAHPNTGARFCGERYPEFESLVELCLRAHRAVPQIKSVGWDVALAEDGPLLVEGNHNWNTARTTHGPLLRTEFLGWARESISHSKYRDLLVVAGT